MQIYNESLIKKWESLELKAYKPTKNDVWTIGWGHTKNVRPGQVITEAQAEEFFDEDKAWVEQFMATKVKVPLSQNQYDAVASWVFNVGAKNASSSTLIRKLNAKDYEGAAHELPRWNKQKGKVLNGLTRRRAEEMEYFLRSSVLTSAPNATPDQVKNLKPIATSKEALGGLLTALAGSALPFLANNGEGLLVALSVALVGLGVLFIANRLYARYKGER